MAASTPRIRVTFGVDPQDRQHLEFDAPFYIGRAEECPVRVQSEYVSRRHAAVALENGQWHVRDLGSSNGIFVGGERVSIAVLDPSLTIRLGVAGPFVHFEVEHPAPAPLPPPPAESPALATTAAYAARYFEAGSGAPAGEHTQMVRRAFQQVHKKQARKYRNVLAGLLLVVALTAGYAYFQHRKIAGQTAVAKELFYSMKTLQVDLANVEQLMRDDSQSAAQIRTFRNREREMEKNYDRFLTALRVYDPKMTEEQRLILRVARIFGECEIDIPPGFMAEVHNYISKWQASPRYSKAVTLAREKGYTSKIVSELLRRNLAPQFFYLALQESDFNEFISGPPTYKGIAKGMWQFIPETAVKYGLRIGPLAEFPRPDVMDDRHNWEKATVAAASYLKDIYSTDAQASGLLVIASYNWGEHHVIPIIRNLPANPKDRNFWRLLTGYRDKVPKETYDYVYYIFSAAVIGENPRLFGFPFDNPLAAAEMR